MVGYFDTATALPYIYRVGSFLVCITTLSSFHKRWTFSAGIVIVEDDLDAERWCGPYVYSIPTCALGTEDNHEHFRSWWPTTELRMKPEISWAWIRVPTTQLQRCVKVLILFTKIQFIEKRRPYYKSCTLLSLLLNRDILESWLYSSGPHTRSEFWVPCDPHMTLVASL
jgi:hypothetical protein